MPEQRPQTSTQVLIFFCALAAAGFPVSLVANVASLFGALPFGDQIWALIPGIFIVWLPAILGAQIPRGTERKDIWKFLLRDCPVWMKAVVYGLPFYVLLNGIIVARTDTTLAAVRGFSSFSMAFYFTSFAMLYSEVITRQEPGRR